MKFDRPALRILIVGGYGSFGARLVTLLKDDARLSLIVAGRDLRKAEQFCASLKGVAAILTPQRFVRGRDGEAHLKELAPDLVIDASGPFQAYGKEAASDPYQLPRAAIACGINYLDLADDAAFVEGIAALDAIARKAQLFVLSGLSTCPALTSAIVRVLASGFARIDEVAGGIAPSPFVDMGRNVLHAIASYAGKPVVLWRDGKKASAPALLSHRRYAIAPPGVVPMKPMRFSLVEVPDLRLMPQVGPSLQRVWFGAAIRPRFQHAGIVALGRLVRAGILRSLCTLVPLMNRVQRHMRWGEHRGGMIVEATGSDAHGAELVRSFHLLAEGDTGPFVPVVAAAAMIGRVCDAKPPPAGARAAWADLQLDDVMPQLSRLKIRTGTRMTLPPDTPLYQRILGDAWAARPPEWRAMHDVRTTMTASGKANVQRGKNPLARLAAFVMRFPPARALVDVEVRFDVKNGVEKWTRNFRGRKFSSTQEEGTGARSHLVIERFGPLAFSMALETQGSRVALVQQGWRAFGVPMPRFLGPRVTAHEDVKAGRFVFFVRITHPVCGLIVQYDGWLKPDA